MNNIIITTDSLEYSFYVFDLYQKKIVHKVPAVSDLCDKFCTSTGRTMYRTFGVCRDDNSVYIGSNSVVGVFDSKTYEYKGLLQGVTNFINSHQMLVSNNKLYTCNPAVDSLSIFDFNTSSNKHFNFVKDRIVDKLEQPQTYKDNDTYHINSIYKHKTSLYVLCNYFGYKSSEVYEIDEITLNVKNVFYRVGHKSHDLFVDDENIYTLSTGNGCLLIYNKITETYSSYLLAQDYKTSWWMRGMKMIDGKLFICLSQNFNIQQDPFKFSIIREFDLEKKRVINDYVVDIIDPINSIA